MKVLHISVRWWFSTGVWVTVSLLKSLGLFAVFWPISTMLLFGWPPLPLLFPNHSEPVLVLIGLIARVFANGPEDRVSIPGRVLPKIFKMVLDTPLLLKREPSGHPRLEVANFTYFTSPLVTVLSVSIIIVITVTIMINSFYLSSKVEYLSFFSISFSFTPLSTGTAKSTFRQVLFFVDYH